MQMEPKLPENYSYVSYVAMLFTLPAIAEVDEIAMLSFIVMHGRIVTYIYDNSTDN